MELIVDAVADAGLFPSVKENVGNTTVIQADRGGLAGFVDSVLFGIGRDSMTAWKEINLKPVKIRVLRIWSHGYVDFAHSERENGNIIFGPDNLKSDNFVKFKSSLDRLSNYFATGARVELRGCIVAKGTGRKLMIDLARLWKGDVFGSDKYQPLILTWPSTVFVARPSASDVAPAAGPDVK